jgi:hypothetical protein
MALIVVRVNSVEGGKAWMKRSRTGRLTRATGGRWM